MVTYIFGVHSQCRSGTFSKCMKWMHVNREMCTPMVGAALVHVSRVETAQDAWSVYICGWYFQ